jgi:hypothetical protein
MSECRITFDLRRGIITVEGPATDVGKLFDGVRTLAPAIKHINIVSTEVLPAPRGVDLGAPLDASDLSPAGRKLGVRDFARQFTLENTYQRIAVIAYHNAKVAEKGTFSVKEMSDWFGLCGFKKPTQMAVALSDARRKYEYVQNKGRDQWAIAVGGENLVLELLESIASKSSTGGDR